MSMRMLVGLTFLAGLSEIGVAQKKTEALLDMIMGAENIALADSLYADGQYQGALEKYDVFLAKHPRNTRILFNRAHCLQSLSLLDSALVAYTRVLAVDKNHVGAWTNRSLALIDLKRFDEARLDAQQAIALDPNRGAAHYNAGLAAVGLNDLDGALSRFSDAIRCDPSDARAYFNRGVIHSWKGRMKDACSDWGRSSAFGYPAATDILKELCK